MPSILRNFTIIAGVAIFCLALLNGSSQDRSVTPEIKSAHNSTLLAGNIMLDENYYDRIEGADVTDPLSEAPSQSQELPSPIALSIPELPQTPAASGSATSRNQSQPVSRAAARIKPNQKFREVWAIVTAYCPCYRCCGRGSPGRTSRGKSAWKPGIAADPKAIPYGTKIKVDGYGIFTVDDTGGAMRRSWRSRGMLHIDIRMTYHWQARKWGRKLMKIKIYE